MNEFVEMILERSADWPKEAQAELMRAVINIEAKHFGIYRLSDDERTAVREGLAQAERGEFVPDEQVAAFFNRYR